jgi:hypothetical protein
MVTRNYQPESDISESLGGVNLAHNLPSINLNQTPVSPQAGKPRT